MARSPRASQRVKVVNILRDAKRDLSTLTVWWTPGTRTLAADRDESGNAWFREREDHEYPENSARAWRRLAEWCRVLAGRLYALAEDADRMASAVEREQACPRCGGLLLWTDDQYICAECGDEWHYETIHHGAPLPR
jgi:ribosomal protein S27AE